MATKLKWAEMTPTELDEAIARCPIAYLPVGSLEWHGRHLPLGTDSYRAEAICLRAAAISGGVVAPPLYITAPGYAAYRGTITFSPRLVEQIADELHREIAKVGFKVLIKMMGHAGKAQGFCFRDEDRRQPIPAGLKTLRIFGAPAKQGTLRLGGGHAGSGETAQCLAAAPECVRVSKFDAAATRLPRYEGLDPATYHNGLPEELHEHVKAHMARTEWLWEEDLVERVTAPDAARLSLEETAQYVAERAMALLAE